MNLAFLRLDLRRKRLAQRPPLPSNKPAAPPAGPKSSFLSVTVLLCAMAAPAPAQPAKDPVDWVNPNIGGIGHLLKATQPSVHLPHAMVSVAPRTDPAIKDRYLADKIYGFPAGNATLMAATGALSTDPNQIASLYDHDLETATPYWYRVLLETYDIEAECTVSERAVFYRFTFPQQAEPRLLWTVNAGSELKLDGPASISGFADGSRGERDYFYAELSKPFASSSPWKAAARGRQPATAHGLALNFASLGDQPLGVRVGVSAISIEQARRNLEREIPDWNFARVKSEARATWNRALGRIQIRGGTAEERTIFYTALYRSLTRMIDVTEEGKYYSPFDRKVHDAAGRSFYINDGLWDTYRTMHPLQLIIEPERRDDIIQSYVRMYEQSGWLPSFPWPSGDFPAMLGYHAAALIADAYAKGFRGFDLEKAYEGLKKRATAGTRLPWTSGPPTALDEVYYERGFFPALAKGEKETEPRVHSFERRQSVAVTLETCYDDWCLAALAQALHHDADAARFNKWGANYRNLFDARSGFMAPKTADGKWVEGYDPKRGGGQGGRDYFAECNGWVYSFHVQHDVPGLIGLMGGREKFIARLDQLFLEQYGGSKYTFLAQFPDMTGLIGQYSHGNEPSFHIPYLYNYAGAPWKTQRRLREIMRLWYNAGPLGICGDEDGGTMSAWYVFSAMGFYPVCPGRPVYDIGSPLFEETKIALGGGKTFTIKAEDVSGKNKYIQAAELNGQPLNRPWFTHDDLLRGGALVLRMGPRPNPAWGSAEAAAPPSRLNR